MRLYESQSNSSPCLWLLQIKTQGLGLTAAAMVMGSAHGVWETSSRFKAEPLSNSQNERRSLARAAGALTFRTAPPSAFPGPHHLPDGIKQYYQAGGK